ncbi:MAG: hypothetical protein ACLR7D_03795 [Lachnospira eligens]
MYFLWWYKYYRVIIREGDIALNKRGDLLSIAGRTIMYQKSQKISVTKNNYHPQFLVIFRSSCHQGCLYTL